MEKFKVISSNNNNGYYEFNLYCNIHNINYKVNGDYKHCKAVLGSSSCGCPMCNPTKTESKQFRNNFKINLLTQYDLLSMSWSVILDLIGEDKLPNEFKCLYKFGENTPERKKMIEDLINTYNIEVPEDEEENSENENNDDENIEEEVDNIENEENIYNETNEDIELDPLKEIKDISSLLDKNDEEFFSTGDKWIHIIHKQMNKLWNLVLRDDENNSTKTIDTIKLELNNNNITKFERYIYEEFINEYNEVINLEVH